MVPSSGFKWCRQVVPASGGPPYGGGTHHTTCGTPPFPPDGHGGGETPVSRPLDVIRSEVAEAAARLNEALGRLDGTWRALHAQQPGFPGGGGSCNSEGGSQPERLHDTYRNDPAIIDLDRLDQAARRALMQATVVYDVATRWGPATMRTTDHDTSGDDWCFSCWRDNRYCEPVANGRYARYCRWCGEFYAAYRVVPPLELIKARHAGRRITTAMVERALTNIGHKIP